MKTQTKIAWLWKGGTFVPCDSVPVLDRGFRYGMSVFESLPVVRKTPLFLTQHHERLQQACAQSRLETGLPPLAGFDTLLRSVEFDAFARLYVTAGDGAVSDRTDNGRVIVFIEPRSLRRTEDAYKLARHPDACIPIFGGLKTANYWPNVAALQRARKNDFNEALTFNVKDELISACMANVFVVRDGAIKTPSPETGARAGVIREWIMHRRAVEELHLTRDDLEHADEIFLTSSGLGVMPVSSLEGRELPSRAIAEELRVEYDREINELAGGG